MARSSVAIIVAFARLINADYIAELMSDTRGQFSTGKELREAFESEVFRNDRKTFAAFAASKDHPHFASVGQDLARLGKTFEKYPEVLITVINCTKGQFGDVMTDKGETICGEYLGSETKLPHIVSFEIHEGEPSVEVYTGDRKGEAFYAYVKETLLSRNTQYCEPKTRMHCGENELAELEEIESMSENNLRAKLRAVREAMNKRAKEVGSEKSAMEEELAALDAEIERKKKQLEEHEPEPAARAAEEARIKELDDQADAKFESYWPIWVRLDDGLKDEQKASDALASHLQDLIVAKKDEL